MRRVPAFRLRSDDYACGRGEGRRGGCDAGGGARSVSDFLEIVGRVVVDSAQRSAGLVAAALESAGQDEPMRALSDQTRAQRLETAAWIADGVISRTTLRPGIVPEAIARILAHGGEIVTDPFPEGLLTVATFRDPAGNVLGLWHDTTR